MEWAIAGSALMVSTAMVVLFVVNAILSRHPLLQEIRDLKAQLRELQAENKDLGAEVKLLRSEAVDLLRKLVRQNGGTE